MSVKFSFDPKKFERDLKKSITKDLKNHPEQILKNRVGESFEATCPNCGRTNITILANGKGRCNTCNRTMSVDLDIRWD